MPHRVDRDSGDVHVSYMVCIVGSVDHRQLVPDLRTLTVNGLTSRHAAVLPLKAMLLPSMYSSSLAKLLRFRPTTGMKALCLVVIHHGIWPLSILCLLLYFQSFYHIFCTIVRH